MSQLDVTGKGALARSARAIWGRAQQRFSVRLTLGGCPQPRGGAGQAGHEILILEALFALTVATRYTLAAGAFRHIGRPGVADEILSVMRSAGYRVTERNPFDAARAASVLRTGGPPIVNRLRSVWSMARPAVLDAFLPAPEPPPDPSAYLAAADDIYVNDAYHSLSTEDYRVTAELIERVRTGAWDPDNNQVDKRSADAIAARGY